MKKRIVALVGVLAMIIAIVPAGKSSAASVTAKALLKTAVEQMKDYGAISFCYNRERSYDSGSQRKTRLECGMGSSSEKYEYTVQLDSSTMEKGYEVWSKKECEWEKDYDDSNWETTGNRNEFVSTKKFIENFCTNYKKASISNNKKNSYIVKVTFKSSNEYYKNAFVTIDKKSGRITKVSLHYKQHSVYLYDNHTYTTDIKSGIYILSNISYCDAALELPEELQ